MAHMKSCRNGTEAFIDKDADGNLMLRCCNHSLIDGMCLDTKPMPKLLGSPMKRTKAQEELDANIVAANSLPLPPKGGFKV